MSARAGVRDRGDVVVSVRVMESGRIELELFRNRRAIIFAGCEACAMRLEDWEMGCRQLREFGICFGELQFS